MAEAERRGGVVPVSAVSGEGVERLIETIAATLTAGHRRYHLRLAAADGARAAWLHAHGEVLETAPDGDEVEPDFAATVVAESGVAVRVLSVSAAVLELDMTGAPVLMFRPSAGAELNVVYRRGDGHIGWIDPSKPAGADHASRA